MSKIINSTTSRLRRSFFPPLLLLLIGTSALRACPMCKDSTADSTQPGGAQFTGLEFNRSIFVMLGGFAGLVGMTGTVLYKAGKSRL